MTCAGCDRDCLFSFCEVRLSDTLRVTVCCSRHVKGVPIKGCLEKAVQKLRPCAGCGIRRGSHHHALLCRECEAALARGRAPDPSAPVWISVNTSNLVGKYVGSAYAERVRFVCRLLGEAVGRAVPDSFDRPAGATTARPILEGDGSMYSHRTDLLIQMPADKVDALRWALVGIVEMQRICYADGLERGHDVLRRLADGEVSVSNYERDRKRG